MALTSFAEENWGNEILAVCEAVAGELLARDPVFRILRPRFAGDMLPQFIPK
jgi:hypothetical protein